MKVSPVRYHGLKRWRVSWRNGGRTRRRFFKAKKAARAFASSQAQELSAGGAAWQDIPSLERIALADCWQKAKTGGYTVADACRAFEAARATHKESLQVDDLIKRFIAAKTAKSIRPESLRVLKVTMKQFQEGRETVPADSISAQAIADWLAAQTDWGQYRRRGAIIDLQNLFSWGVKAGLIERNPVAAVERPKIDHGTPKIFTVDQCRELLKLCRARFKALLPWLTISLFAGLRPAEAERLRWEDVSGGFVRLASHQTKGRARRLVTIRPTLSKWLALCRKDAGPVCLNNHRKRIGWFKVASGLTWPRDVLRHSFISYEVAQSKDVDATALEAGNTPDVIFTNYREVVSPDDAAKFWKLTP